MTRIKGFEESEVLKAGASDESYASGGNKKSPTEKSGSGQASTTSSKRRRRGAGNGLAMYLSEEGPPSICSTDVGSTWEEWQRQTAGYLETDNNIEAEMEEAGGRPGMNFSGLPKTGLD